MMNLLIFSKLLIIIVFVFTGCVKPSTVRYSMVDIYKVDITPTKSPSKHPMKVTVEPFQGIVISNHHIEKPYLYGGLRDGVVDKVLFNDGDVGAGTTEIVAQELISCNLFRAVNTKNSSKNTNLLLGGVVFFHSAEKDGLVYPNIRMSMSLTNRNTSDVVWKDSKNGLFKKSLDKAKNQEESAKIWMDALKETVEYLISKMEIALSDMNYSAELVMETLQPQSSIKVAVLFFDDITPEAKQAGYGKSISNMVITSLTKTGYFIVVERARVDKILRELKLQHSGITDQSNTKKIGKILNTDLLVMGSVSMIGKKMIAVDCQMVNVETGQVILADNQQCSDINAIPNMIDNLAKRMSYLCLWNQ
ncbi:MAG: CsgG/HfaB family protein [Elusimicrobiota bacterium]|nr:CsgG/HfaB family protein [Elusimicrobiota bacterium]